MTVYMTLNVSYVTYHSVMTTYGVQHHTNATTIVTDRHIVLERALSMYVVSLLRRRNFPLILSSSPLLITSVRKKF